MKSRSPKLPLPGGTTSARRGKVLPWSLETSTTGNVWPAAERMNETYTVPSGATATAGSQAPDEPGMAMGSLHVVPPSADLAKAMRGRTFDPHIQAAYTRSRLAALMTSALSGAHALLLTSVTGPTVTPGAAGSGVGVVNSRPVHATAAVVRPTAAATAKFLSLMAILRRERGR